MCETSTIMTTPNQNDLHSCWIIYTKSDGKEGLTVTETKPMIRNSSMDQRDFRFGNAHDALDDNDDADDPSLAEMLDPELQPEQPIPDNEESQAIYREHRRLAKEYLRVDTKLYYAQDFKEKILKQLEPEERQKKQEMLRKMNEKQELLELYNNLKQQRENLLAEQARGSRSNNAGNMLPQQQQQQKPQQQDTIADDGWVVIQPNQQNT